MPHPHGEDCRCPALQPGDGLLAFTVDCDHYSQLQAALAPIADTATLRVLTTDPAPANLVPLPEAKPCDGSMVCQCPSCTADRAKLVRRGVRPSRPLPIRRAA